MASAKSKTGHVEQYNSAVIFYNKGDFSKAIAGFRAACSAAQKNEKYMMALANAYNNRGVFRYGHKKYDEAASDFKRALEIEKKDGRYMSNL
ncbi:MAG: tetratricopeptide repeat protein, partial [Candidatus Micrarchaeota archaeon]